MRDLRDNEDSFIKAASEAADLILEHVDKGEYFYVESHLDADGITAASIIGMSLHRLGASFRIRIERWFDEKISEELASEADGLIILTDMGSGYLDLLTEKLSEKRILILDHHQPVRMVWPENFLHVNPHIYGIDGAKDISAAGVSYLVSKCIDDDNVDLAHLAVVGALGDMQDKYEKHSLGGLNSVAVEDAVKSGYLTVDTDMLLFGRETRPIHKALAYNMNPFIPGISGREDEALALLSEVGIKVKERERWRALRDLTHDEKKRLFSAIANHLSSKGYQGDVIMEMIGTVYTLKMEEPWTPLRDAREFALLLNATGRIGKPGLGVAVCMGDRGVLLEKANSALEEYKRNIVKYISWLDENPELIEELDSIYVVHGGNSIDERMISAISTILSTSLKDKSKPVVAYSSIPEENVIKVSARANDHLVSLGLNLGEIIKVASERSSGVGGGHNIAAGAQIPYEKKDLFINLVNNLVKERIGGKLDDEG